MLFDIILLILLLPLVLGVNAKTDALTQRIEELEKELSRR